MSAVATFPPDSNRSYLVRVTDSSIVFAPINTPPAIKNFFLLETCEQYKYNPKEQRFCAAGAKAILLVKKGDRTHRLEGFTAGSLEALMKKVAARIKEHYLRMS